MINDKPIYFEFFAGGGMARAGLGSGWRCAFANDFDDMKATAYRANWSADELVVEDITQGGGAEQFFKLRHYLNYKRIDNKPLLCHCKQ